MDIHDKFMKEAIKQAKKCLVHEDVPIGAIITYKNKVIAKAYNKKEWMNCATYHAEILAIQKACLKIKNFRLCDCNIYVTKEPCLMCLGAILSARIKSVYFGAYDKKYGTEKLAQNINFNHKSEIVGGICENECEELLSSFFKKIRENKCKLKLK